MEFYHFNIFEYKMTTAMTLEISQELKKSPVLLKSVMSGKTNSSVIKFDCIYFHTKDPLIQLTGNLLRLTNAFKAWQTRPL